MPNATHIAVYADLVHSSKLPGIPPMAAFLLRAAALLTLWSFRSQSRRQLAGLNNSQLRDIGLSRQEAEAESMRRFWMG